MLVMMEVNVLRTWELSVPRRYDTEVDGSGSVDSGGGGLRCLAGWRRGCNVNGRAGRLDGLVDGLDNSLNDYVDILDLLVLVLTVGRMGESRASKSSNGESDNRTHLDGCCWFDLVSDRVWTKY
jgi:hypothetical protein